MFSQFVVESHNVEIVRIPGFKTPPRPSQNDNRRKALQDELQNLEQLVAEKRKQLERLASMK